MGWLARRGERRLVLEPQAAYALWAEAYPPYAHNALMRVEQEAMAGLLRGISPSRAIDVGTGTGRYLRVLLETGVPWVAGLDLSAPMLARARAQALPLVRADARALPLAAASVDLVLASLMVGDVEDLYSWTREMARTLTSDGSLLYSDFHPTWAERGWERTFETADGRSRRLRYHPHSLEDHGTALAAAGLEAVEVREPGLTDSRTPVCVVLHARKR